VDEAAETVGGEAVGGEAVGGEVAAAVPWLRQGGGGCCLRGGQRGSDKVGPWFRPGG
jgi:hypothetical protein